ncbi:MAG: hypothetical protein HN976_35525 [Lentisphaerae bacterium]|nr:hypothetical protein [Lentisphaerota bacterium]
MIDITAECGDPDQFGYLDAAEYLAGVALVAAQRYLSATLPSSGLSKKEALDLPPTLPSGQTCVALINGAANFWKHGEEWSDPPTIQQALTARTVESAGIEAQEYVCTEALAALVGLEQRPFLRLRELLAEWRSYVIGKCE